MKWINHKIFHMMKNISSYPHRLIMEFVHLIDSINEKYILIVNDSLLADANQLRAKVGLSSVQEQLLKIRFRDKFPQSPYMLPVTRGIINLTGFPEEVLKKILEKGQKY